ncbi:MAG: Ig-like domain-containing protein, partial [Chloroflexi bacterium]|nr:Ig-like domain-containing protein [Chloroflexota bacterium]
MLTYGRVTKTLLAAALVVAFSLFATFEDFNSRIPRHSPSDGGVLVRVRAEIDPSAPMQAAVRLLSDSALGTRGLAFADHEVNVNDKLQLIALQTPPAGSTPPGGTYTITTTFKNISDTTFSAMFFRVAVLQYSDGNSPHPTLANGDRGGGGVGAEKDAVLPGGQLEPGETFVIPFDIQLPRIARFMFFVDALSFTEPEGDSTPPTIIASIAPSANPAGWHNTAVTVSFDCADAGSGVASCTAPATLSTEGAGQTITGEAVDNEGNSATASVTLNIDLTPPALAVESHQDGQVVNAPGVTLSGTVSDALSGVAFVSCNGVAAQLAGSNFSCALTLVEGINEITVQAQDVAGNTTVVTLNVTLDTPDETPPSVPQLVSPDDNASTEDFTPTFVWTDVTDPSGVTYQLQVDDDPGFSSPEIDVQTSDTTFTVPDLDPLQVGGYFWRVRAIDGAGNEGAFTDSRSLNIELPPQAVMVAIELSPGGVRFTQLDDVRQLTVTGIFSNGARQEVTSASAGTTYESSNRFVAGVGADGLLTSIANGDTVITAHNGGLADTADVLVEVGVALQSLGVTPPAATLRNQGETQQLEVAGEFSDGSLRDLTSPSTGTAYESSDPAVALVSPEGVVTAQSNGAVMIMASNEGLTDEAQIMVAIAGGTGFLRGEAYDDTKGLPLAGAMVTLLEDGGGLLASPLKVITDERGQYLLPGLEGDALVLIEKDGFTSVERRGAIPRDTAVTLLDARLTPLDSVLTLVSPASERQASDSAGNIILDFPAGSVIQDTEIRLTSTSGQGLMSRLPAGWSPIAAVDVLPRGLELAQAATLRVPNGLNLPPGTPVPVALYDTEQHAWRALGDATVSSDGSRIEHGLLELGQVVFLLPDSAPFTPADPVAGELLQGVDLLSIPSGATASGQVVPRTSPAGEGARAVGMVVLQSPTPLPSGTVLQARVSERFDLFIGASVTPRSFVEDLVLYQHPLTGLPNSLSATFPITPSLTFGILRLSLGIVHLDVAPPGPDTGGTVIGSAGGSASSAEGDTVQIPTGALGQDTIAELFRLDGSKLPLVIPGGLELLAALEFGLREPLSQGATLTIPRPIGLPDDAQVIVAQVISDPSNIRRMKIAALGEIGPGIVASAPIVGATPLDGVTEGGLYLFLRASAPLGFVSGTVFAPNGSTPRAMALVRSDTAPFADVTGADGGYLVAGQVGASATVTATDPSTGDFTSGVAAITSQGQVVTLDLTLGLVAPVVMETTPVIGAVNVPINTPISVRFSEPIAPATVTPSSARLEFNGVALSAQRILSTDGLRLSLIPDEQLESLSQYTLVLTDAIRDPSGNALIPFSFSFTTVDTSKPPQPEAGQIIAGLPDQDSMAVIIGTQGATEPGTGVTATNLRSQETSTVLSNTDGSFRVRLPVIIGDELAMTFRNAEGQEQTIAITQLEDPDGSTALGLKGGTFRDSEGRVGRMLPRALVRAAVFRLESLEQSQLPPLPAGFGYADSFEVTMQGGAFNSLQSLRLTEGQNRFPPAIDTSAPFETEGDFIVPGNFLVNGNLNFQAEAKDAAGLATRVNASTRVVAANPDTSLEEFASTERFPTVFLFVQKQSQPNQQVGASAIAPTARIDFELPAQAGVSGPLILARLTQLDGEARLAVVDRLDVASDNGALELVTAGRELPGAAGAGQYAVVSATSPLAFVAGRLTGPAVAVSVDGLPFVFEASTPNSSFSVPVVAGQPFSLSFIDPQTGEVKGTASGQAPASGGLDIGEPLGDAASQLQVSAQPDANSVVDITQPIIFDFSEPIDTQTLNANNIVVTDALGGRIFGEFEVSGDGGRVTFTPLGTWLYGQTVRYGVSTRVLGVSGARLPQTFSGSFTTFGPSQIGGAAVGNVRDTALFGSVAVIGTDTGIKTVDMTNPVSPTVLDEFGVSGGVSGVAVVDGVSFNDRNGNLVQGAIALAASGDAATGGSLEIFDLNDPANLALLGSAQLPGTGAPKSVVFGANDTALVAIQGVGIQEVLLSQAIPEDTANPGGALGKSFPPGGSDGVNSLALLDGGIVAVGVNGLTILDAETFEVVGNVSTQGNPQGVAVLPDFRMDVNGDGAIDPLIEVFDLAVVASGANGLLL